MRKRGKLAISHLLASIILIGLVLVGGIVTFVILNGVINTEAKKTQVNFEYLGLYKSIGDPKIIFSATLKNTGNKPIKILRIKLHNETEYVVPSISAEHPLAPGRGVGVVLTPKRTPGYIHADWYIVGLHYSVQVRGVATDESSFSHTTTVICLGQQGGEHEERMQTGAFTVSDELIFPPSEQASSAGISGSLYVAFHGGGFGNYGFIDKFDENLTCEIRRYIPEGVFSLLLLDNYLYAGTSSKILKLSPADLTILEEREVGGPVKCLISKENIIYAGLGTSPGKIMAVNPDNLEILHSLTLQTGENVVTALTFAEDNYLYAGLYTAPALIVRINVTSWTEEAVAQVNYTGCDGLYQVTGRYVKGLVARDDFLFVACKKHNDAPEGYDENYWAGGIFRVNLTDLTVVNGSIWYPRDPLVAYGFRLYNDLTAFSYEGDVLYAGTPLYGSDPTGACPPAEQGALIQIKRRTTSQIGNEMGMTCGMGYINGNDPYENSILQKDGEPIIFSIASYPAWILPNGEYLYVGVNTGGIGKIYKVNATTLECVAEYQYYAGVDFSTLDDYSGKGFIASDNLFIYAGVPVAPPGGGALWTRVLKIYPDDLTVVQSLDLIKYNESGVGEPRAATVSGASLYVSTTGGFIIKIDLPTFSVVDAISRGCYSLASDDEYLYVGTNNKVIRISTQSLQTEGEINLKEAGGYSESVHIKALVINDGILYAGCTPYGGPTEECPAKVFAIDLTNFSVISQTPVYAKTGWKKDPLTSLAILNDEALYVGLGNIWWTDIYTSYRSGGIVKLSLPNLEKTAKLRFPEARIMGLVCSQNMLYAYLEQEGDDAIVKIDPIHLLEVDRVVLDGYLAKGYLYENGFVYANLEAGRLDRLVKVSVGPENTHTLTLQISPVEGGQVEVSQGNVGSLPAGVHLFYHGQNLTLTATPNQNYTFSNWILDDVMIFESTINLEITEDHILTAVFQEKPKYYLTITANLTEGNTTPTPGTYEYHEGDEVTVTATPNSGYTFEYWLLNGEQITDNPITFTITENCTLEAVFSEIPVGTAYLYIVPAVEPGSGQVWAIKIDGVIYTEETTIEITLGEHQLEIVPPSQPWCGWNRWATDGEVSVEDEFAYETTLIVTGDGTLEAWISCLW